MLESDPLPEELEPGESIIRTLDEQLTAQKGLYTNTATVKGYYNDDTYQDTDYAHYYGADPAISLKKYVSVDLGTTWKPADEEPGPEVVTGQEVHFKFVAENTGNVTLIDLELSDDEFDLSGMSLPEYFSPGESYQAILEGVEAEAKQHTNTAKVTGYFESLPYEDTDTANYFGKSPAEGGSITVKKFISLDEGESWDPADESPGPEAIIGQEVQFKFVVTNDGSEPLNNLSLTDNEFGDELEALLSENDKELPNELAPGNSFQRILTGVEAEEGEHTNTATVTGKHNDTSYEDTDDAHYKGVLCPVPEIEVDLDPPVLGLGDPLEVSWYASNPGEDEITQDLIAHITLYDHLGNEVKDDGFTESVTIGADGRVRFRTTTIDTSTGEWETGCGYRFELKLETDCGVGHDALEVIVRCMETAYAGDKRGVFPPGGWWFYYDTETGGEQTIRAGQFFNAGKVKIEAVNGKWHIDMELADGWSLKREIDEEGLPIEGQPVDEAVKLQGYEEGDLPGSRPPSGQFTTYKGEELEVTVDDDNYRYFAIHLDVEFIGDPGDREIAP